MNSFGSSQRDDGRIDLVEREPLFGLGVNGHAAGAEADDRHAVLEHRPGEVWKTSPNGPERA